MKPLNPPLRDWPGRRVWIVGASSGIGAATARLLHREGAMLALSARSAPALQALAEELGGVGDASAQLLPLDITDAQAVAAAARRLLASWGQIDLVLVMAGTYQPMRADSLDLGAARAMLETNLIGPFNLLAALTPALLAQRRGAIALVASVAGYGGLPRALAYGPSKAALINLAESLYLDLHPRGIGVHLISPGFVATPLTAANDFHMPALISAEQAAREILRGLARGDFEIHFPRRFSRTLKLLRLLPYRAYFAAVRRATGL